LALRPSRVKGSFSGRKYIIFDHLLRKGHKSTS
jgi:hypothetical protein